VQSKQNGTTTMPNIDIIFSDVDGTLVHYPENVQDSIDTEESLNPIIKLPPSSTGMRGIISSETMRQCADLRRSAGRTALVLVSGMRSTTLWKRIPYLPRADAYCSEAGGRIFYPVPASTTTSTTTTTTAVTFRLHPYQGATEEDLTPFGLEEDMEWRTRMQRTTGEDGFSGNELDESPPRSVVSIDQREGLLWAFCRDLQKKGFVIDTKGYSTCFRVNRSQQTSVSDADFDALYSMEAPDGLATSVNLGCIDFYPVDSGKKLW